MIRKWKWSLLTIYRIQGLSVLGGFKDVRLLFRGFGAREVSTSGAVMLRAANYCKKGMGTLVYACAGSHA